MSCSMSCGSCLASSCLGVCLYIATGEEPSNEWQLLPDPNAFACIGSMLGITGSTLLGATMGSAIDKKQTIKAIKDSRRLRPVD